MKILHFLKDETIDYAAYAAGETPVQWFDNATAARLVDAGAAIIVVDGPHTPSWEAWQADADAATAAALALAETSKAALPEQRPGTTPEPEPAKE